MADAALPWDTLVASTRGGHRLRLGRSRGRHDTAQSMLYVLVLEAPMVSWSALITMAPFFRWVREKSDEEAPKALEDSRS